MLKNKKKVITVIIILLTVIVAVILGSVFIYKNNINSTIKKQETIFNNQNEINEISFNVDVKNDKDESAIAYLTIEEIGLYQAPIKEGIEDKTLNKYIGHFPGSAYLEGNVALAGHNRGYNKNYFEKLKKLKGGELIIYQTKSETKIYKVTEIKNISEKNVDVVKNTKENKITLITCIENTPNKRLCIVGIEI